MVAMPHMVKKIIKMEKEREREDRKKEREREQALFIKIDL